MLKLTTILGDNQAFIQKIYSTTYWICFSIRIPGKTLWLYMGRGNRYEGLMSFDSPPPKELRRRDTYLEYIRKHIGSCQLRGVEVDTKDRIFALSYQKYGRKNIFGVFYKARTSYFAHLAYDEKKKNFSLFCSWRGHSPWEDPIETELFFNIFDDLERKELDPKKKSLKEITLTQLMDEEAKQVFKKNKLKSKVLKKKELIQKDLESIKKWKILYEIAPQNLDQYQGKCKVEGIKFNFSRCENEHHKRDLIYQKIKRLKKAQIIQEKRLEALVSQKKEEISFEFKSSPIKPFWQNKLEEVKKENSKKETEYKVFDFPGYRLGVGLSSRGNDLLRKDFASKSDWWFHLDAERSPHIIAKVQNQSLSQEILQQVAQTMKEALKSDRSQISLVYTQVKNLRGVKGSPGKVLFKKEKRVDIFL